MGLREKVALFIMFVFLVQLMYGECVTRTKKMKTSYDISNKPKRSKLRKHSKTITQKPVKRDEDVVKRFNFPEVEYSLPTSQLSPLLPKQKFDLRYGQETHSPQSVSKSDTDLPNKLKNERSKINRKNTKTDAVTKKISKIPSYPEVETLPKPISINYKDYFPSVDYPLDAADLWTPYYWNRIPQIQPEIKFDVKDVSINTKATKEISKRPKRPQKDASVTKILNSIINSETKYKGEKELSTKSNLKSDTQQTVNNKKSVKPDSRNETCSIVVTENTNQTSVDDLNSPYFRNTNKLSCDEIINSSILMTLTTPPTLIVTPTYDNEPSTTSHFISPLTTSSPTVTSTDEHIVYGKETVSNSGNKDIEENDEMPDDMGYTLMYPEVISYLSTSTTAPLLTDNADMWMYPELDNHTLNTYSDEVDQCYILVH